MPSDATTDPHEPPADEQHDILDYLESQTQGDGPLDLYLAKARWICPSIHPFVDITEAFYAGVPEAMDDGQAPMESSASESEEEELLYVFNAIMKLDRGFVTVLEACKHKPTALLTWITKIIESANAARSDDTGKLKSAILNYLHEDPTKDSRFREKVDDYIPLLPSVSKNFRGFRHADTASLLCPLRLLDQFEADPVAFMDQVEDKVLEITDEDFPAFLYENGTVYDEKNEDLGLFRGYLLVRVYRSIFTGPSSAMDPGGKGANKTKAKLFKLSEVTGRTIAYACVQAYIALSSMSQWGSYDDLFNLQDFYTTIVMMFEQDPNDPWVIETLEWWNEQVPALRKGSSKKKKNGTRNSGKRTRPSPMERIAAQRARRHKESHPSEEIRSSPTLHDPSDLDGRQVSTRPPPHARNHSGPPDPPSKSRHSQAMPLSRHNHVGHPSPPLDNHPSNDQQPHRSRPVLGQKGRVSDENDDPDRDSDEAQPGKYLVSADENSPVGSRRRGDRLIRMATEEEEEGDDLQSRSCHRDANDVSPSSGEEEQASSPPSRIRKEPGDLVQQQQPTRTVLPRRITLTVRVPQEVAQSSLRTQKRGRDVFDTNTEDNSAPTKKRQQPQAGGSSKPAVVPQAPKKPKATAKSRKT